jgi:defect in organelle trafficking protein DotD
MNKKNTILLILCIILTGCAHQYKKPPLNYPSDDANIKLAEAAHAVSNSMYEMARVEKVVSPPNLDNILTIPNVFCLQTKASVDWSGPIEEVTARIAQAAHYKFRILGTPPAIPVLINLAVKDISLADILRNIDYQAGIKAYIHVYPRTQVVELRYAKFYP